LDRVLNDLTGANKAKDRIAAELSASRAKRVTLAIDLNTTRGENEQASAEKDQAVAEKKVAVEQ
jgi:hypothetical protein